jgi:cyclophilin family peptidyl-prolyl cis-trans isomerase
MKRTSLAVIGLLAGILTVKAQIADFTEYAGAPPRSIDLAAAFSAEPDVTDLVRMTTVLGDIDIELFGQQKPITVANFVKYIDQGRYVIDDPTTHQPASSFIHRSIPTFIIQGGGFLGTVNSQNTAIQPTQVLTFPPIQNEPGISNTRGTIAMAKLGNDPNSATSQWFINLSDNGGPPNNLDTQNGGFTVFGRVIGNGMTVADAIAAVQRYNFSSADPNFSNLPLRNWNGTSAVKVENLVSIPGITHVVAFTVASDNPNVTATIKGTSCSWLPVQPAPPTSRSPSTTWTAAPCLRCSPST